LYQFDCAPVDFCLFASVCPPSSRRCTTGKVNDVEWSSISEDYRRVMHSDSIDQVLAETASGTSWALSDHLVTIHEWADATTGAMTRYVYSSFGKVLSIKGGDPKNTTGTE
jgi:hypothetical protein